MCEYQVPTGTTLIAINPNLDVKECDSWDYKDLQAFAKRVGLSASGKKTALISRIRRWHSLSFPKDKMDPVSNTFALQDHSGVSDSLLSPLKVRTKKHQDGTPVGILTPSAMKYQSMLKQALQKAADSSKAPPTPSTPMFGATAMAMAPPTPATPAGMGALVPGRGSPPHSQAQQKKKDSKKKRLSFSLLNGIKIIPPRAGAPPSPPESFVFYTRYGYLPPDENSPNCSPDKENTHPGGTDASGSASTRAIDTAESTEPAEPEASEVLGLTHPTPEEIRELEEQMAEDARRQQQQQQQQERPVPRNEVMQQKQTYEAQGDEAEQGGGEEEEADHESSSLGSDECQVVLQEQPVVLAQPQFDQVDSSEHNSTHLPDQGHNGTQLPRDHVDTTHNRVFTEEFSRAFTAEQQQHLHQPPWSQSAWMHNLQMQEHINETLQIQEHLFGNQSVQTSRRLSTQARMSSVTLQSQSGVLALRATELDHEPVTVASEVFVDSHSQQQQQHEEKSEGEEMQDKERERQEMELLERELRLHEELQKQLEQEDRERRLQENREPVTNYIATEFEGTTHPQEKPISGTISASLTADKASQQNQRQGGQVHPQKVPSRIDVSRQNQNQKQNPAVVVKAGPRSRVGVAAESSRKVVEGPQAQGHGHGHGHEGNRPRTHGTTGTRVVSLKGKTQPSGVRGPPRTTEAKRPTTTATGTGAAAAASTAAGAAAGPAAPADPAAATIGPPLPKGTYTTNHANHTKPKKPSKKIWR